MTVQKLCSKTSISGFTLVELMVAVAVAAVLLAIAAPNFSEMLKQNRVQSQVRELYSQLAYARSEAMARGVRVTICHSNDESSCSGTWSNGWIICVDNNGDGSCAVGDALLRVYSDLHTNTLKVVDNQSPGVAQDFLTFNTDGSTTLSRPATLTVCDADADVKFARAVLKTSSGQLLLASLNSGTGVYRDVSGGNLTCP